MRDTFTLTKGFVFSTYRCSKQSVSRLLILNWSEHFIRWGCFQICSGILLYAWEVIHLINKGVTSTVWPCAIRENNLETFEKLFSIIQSHCSIYSHFAKLLHWIFYECWHQAVVVMKNLKSPHFLHLTSLN